MQKCCFPITKTGKNAPFDFWLSKLVTFCNNLTNLNLAKATTYNRALHNLSLISWSTPKGKAAGLVVDVKSTSQNSFSFLQRRGCCHFHSCDKAQIKQADPAMQTAGLARWREVVRQRPVKRCCPGLWDACGCLFYYFVPGQPAIEELTGGCYTNRAARCIGVLCNLMPSQAMDQ